MGRITILLVLAEPKFKFELLLVFALRSELEGCFTIVFELSRELRTCGCVYRAYIDP